MGCCHAGGCEETQGEHQPPKETERLNDLLMPDAEGAPVICAAIVAEADAPVTPDAAPRGNLPAKRNRPLLSSVVSPDNMLHSPSCSSHTSSSSFQAIPLRWVVNVASWSPVGGAAGPEFAFLLNTINEEREREGVLRYTSFSDQKRALVSRLLARRCCCYLLDVQHETLEVARTKGRKPFMSSPRSRAPDYPSLDDLYPNFNFNISHDGDHVVLAAEPVCLCGVDVVAPRERVGGRTSLRRSFTSAEWESIQSKRTEEERDDHFRLLWSCKEAYVKARGDGLRFDISRAEFTVGEVGSEGAAVVHLAVDGVRMPHWRFYSSHLPDGSRVTVARGPPSDAVDEEGGFKKTFTKPMSEFTEEEWLAELSRPSPPFSQVGIGFLVPPHLRGGYKDLGGTIPSPACNPLLTPPSKVPRASLFGHAGASSPLSRRILSLSLTDSSGTEDAGGEEESEFDQDELAMFA